MNDAHAQQIRDYFIGLLQTTPGAAKLDSEARETVATISGSLARYAYDLGAVAPASGTDTLVPHVDKEAIAVAYVRACERHSLDDEDETLSQYTSELMVLAYLLGRMRGRIGGEEAEAVPDPIPPINSTGGNA